MAGMRAVHKKNGTTFKYSGDLKETIEKAEKELKEKEGTTQWLFLKWQYDNARKAFEKYNRRLEDLKDFIKLAKEELAKREEAAGHGRDNTHQGKATGEGRINRGKGSDEGSGTRSSLMWETIHIIENMGEWRPRYVIWENVKNVKSKYMRPNFDRYMVEMERLGYTNNFEVLDAREFGLPQARERVFTVSVLNGERFEFDDLIRTPMRNLQEFLEDDASVPDVYDVTQPSVLACIGEKGIRRATVITDCAYTITTRQDRTPAQVIDRGGGRYRYLTERECWRLMGYTDEDFDRAKAVQERNGKYYKALYDQAGNSIAVPIFESIFRKIILHEVA